MKKYLKVFMLLMMVFVLTGCMKLNVNFEVKSDASMTMSVEMLMEEAALTASSGLSAEESIKKMEEQMKTSNAGMKDAKFTPLNKTIDGKKWMGYKVETKDAGNASFVKEKKIDGKDSLVLTLPMNEATGGAADPSTIANSGYSLSKMKEMGMEMNANITMPNKPTTNVGKVDGNKVTVDLLEMSATGMTQDIIISSEKGSSFPMGLILGGVGAVVVVLVLVLILKKKKTTEAIIEGDTIIQPMADASIGGEGEAKEAVAESANILEEAATEVPVETIEDIISEDEPQINEQKKFCSNCGASLVENTDYCPNCGVKIKE